MISRLSEKICLKDKALLWMYIHYWLCQMHLVFHTCSLQCLKGRDPCLQKVPRLFRNEKQIQQPADTFPTVVLWQDTEYQSSKEVSRGRFSCSANWPLAAGMPCTACPAIREGTFRPSIPQHHHRWLWHYLCSPGLILCPASPSKPYFTALRSQHSLFSVLLQYWLPGALSGVLLPQESPPHIS